MKKKTPGANVLEKMQNNVVILLQLKHFCPIMKSLKAVNDISKSSEILKILLLDEKGHTCAKSKIFKSHMRFNVKRIWLIIGKNGSCYIGKNGSCFYLENQKSNQREGTGRVRKYCSTIISHWPAKKLYVH